MTKSRLLSTAGWPHVPLEHWTARLQRVTRWQKAHAMFGRPFSVLCGLEKVLA